MDCVASLSKMSINNNFDKECEVVVKKVVKRRKVVINDSRREKSGKESALIIGR